MSPWRFYQPGDEIELAVCAPLEDCERIIGNGECAHCQRAIGWADEAIDQTPSHVRVCVECWLIWLKRRRTQ